jgi:hypothetical protein
MASLKMKSSELPRDVTKNLLTLNDCVSSCLMKRSRWEETDPMLVWDAGYVVEVCDLRSRRAMASATAPRSNKAPGSGTGA